MMEKDPLILSLLKALRTRLPLFTNKLTTNFTINNIVKEIIDENNINYTITTKENINDLIMINDEIILCGIKYKYKIAKIERLIGSTDLYKNQTIITTQDQYIWSNLKTLEITDVITDTNYNGIHEVLVEDGFNLFKININNKLNINTNVINNEGYYNLELRNLTNLYGTLNGNFKVIEIIDDYNFKININKLDANENQYFFDNIYDDLNFTNATVRANPTIEYAIPDLAFQYYFKERKNDTQQNNYLFLSIHDHSSSTPDGVSTADISNFVNIQEYLRMQIAYQIRLTLYSNIIATKKQNDSTVELGYLFRNLANEIEYGLTQAIVGKSFEVVYGENNSYSTKLILGDHTDDEEIENTRIMHKIFNYKLTMFLNEFDIQNIDNIGVPLKQVDIDIYGNENFNNSIDINYEN